MKISLILLSFNIKVEDAKLDRDMKIDIQKHFVNKFRILIRIFLTSKLIWAPSFDWQTHQADRPSQ